MKLEGRISERELTRLQERVEAVNKKATKLENEPFLLKFIPSKKVRVYYTDTTTNIPAYRECTLEEVETIKKSVCYTHIESLFEVVLEGSPVKLGEYLILGRKVRHNSEYLMFNLGTTEVPQVFWNSNFSCVHCDTNRLRNTVYYVQSIETGEISQVGSTCVKDFTGHSISSLTQYEKLINDMQEEWDENEEATFKQQLNVVKYLACVLDSINIDGFVSKTNDPTYSTSEVAFSMYEDKKYSISETSREQAKKIVQWTKENFEEYSIKNDFWHNMLSLVQDSFFHLNYRGYVAYLPVAYKNETAPKPEEDNRVSHAVGHIKEKIEIDVTVKNVVYYDTDFGRIGMVIMKDLSGNILVWKTSTRTILHEVNLDRVFRIKGTVKAHTKFNGIMQTLLLRVKVLTSENK